MAEDESKILKIFIIAGEASGDQLGARFVADFYKNQKIQVQGVGGNSLMKVCRFQSLFPMEDLSVMGVAEVLPRLPLLLKRIKQTVEAIHEFQPDIVLTIDAPDFCFRVIKKYQKKYIAKGEPGSPKFHHLVAPTVWAWRPKRAKKVAKILDHLYCLFPFEPLYFELEGLSASYIGHPFLSSYTDLENKRQLWRKTHGYQQDDALLGLFPGSRNGEIERMLPVLLDTIELLQKKKPELNYVLLTLPHLKSKIQASVNQKDLNIKIIDDIDQKEALIASLDYAIATSGTIGFELSLARVPHIVAYKMNGVTRFLARFLVKTPYMHLTNIHLQELIVPEFFQEDCTAKNMVMAVETLFSDQGRKIQMQGFDRLQALLKV